MASSRAVNHHDFLVSMEADIRTQESLIVHVAELLEYTVELSDSEDRKTILAFAGLKSTISPSTLVSRIEKISKASPCCLVVGLIYLERLKKHYPSFHVTSRSFVRLFVTSSMIAAKFLEDFYCDIQTWADIGGITHHELRKLELELLVLLDFKIHIQREEYDWYAWELRHQVRTPKLVPPRPLFSLPSICDLPSLQMLRSLLSLNQPKPDGDGRLESQGKTDDDISETISSCTDSRTVVIYRAPPPVLSPHTELYIA
jgi:hypothetical protein